MQLKELVIIFLVLVCAFVNKATALKCYKCISTKDWSSCDDIKRETECSAGITHCIKAKVEAKGGGADAIQYAKLCSNFDCEEFKNNTCNQKTFEGVTFDCDISCCSEDLCNLGSAPMVSVMMILTCALLSAIF